MPATYEPIATTTLGSNASSVSFTSISGSYTDLILVCFYRDTRAQKYSYPYVRFNSDSGSNYSVTSIYGSGSAAFSSRASNQTGLNIGEGAGASSPANEYSPIILNIINYSNATTNKTTLNRTNNVSGDGGLNVGAQVGLWRSTSAITRIDIYPDGGGGTNIASGSTFTLYGIKAA